MTKTKARLLWAIMISMVYAMLPAVFAADQSTDNSKTALLAQFQQQLAQAQQSGSQAVAATTGASSALNTDDLSGFTQADGTGSESVFSDANNSVSSAPKTVRDYLQQPATANQQAAFDAVAQQAMPMTPDQIKAMKRMMTASQRAASEPAEIPARPVTSSTLVNLAPGATPPVIRLSAGFITTLVFVDSTGADWAITAIDNGNPDAFNISWDKKGNTLMIQAKKAYNYGNIAVSLKELSTPVMLTLVPGQNEIDYRVDLRVSGFAPDSKDIVTFSRLPDSANRQLLRVLDNIPPQGAKTLEITGGGATGWLADNKMYLRTRFVLLSPGYIGVMKSPDGTYAYELQKTPVVLVSQFGKPVELRVKGAS